MATKKSAPRKTRERKPKPRGRGQAAGAKRSAAPKKATPKPVPVPVKRRKQRRKEPEAIPPEPPAPIEISVLPAPADASSSDGDGPTEAAARRKAVKRAEQPPEAAAPSGTGNGDGGGDGFATELGVAPEVPVPAPDFAEPSIPESSIADTHGYLKGMIEAVLFVTEQPLGIKEIARAVKLDRRRVEELVGELRQEHSNRGIRIDEVADGFMFRTSPVYADCVRNFLAQRPVRLSRAQVETLAIVAYKQPITRPEIDDIRGVDCGPVLKGLLERELVRILGKKEEPGRPSLYGTTQAFLELFGLKGLSELPTLREFAELSDDSRRKFELELGEEAPLGPVDAAPPAADSAQDEHGLPATQMGETQPTAEEQGMNQLEETVVAREQGLEDSLGDNEEENLMQAATKHEDDKEDEDDEEEADLDEGEGDQDLDEDEDDEDEDEDDEDEDDEDEDDEDEDEDDEDEDEDDEED